MQDSENIVDEFKQKLQVELKNLHNCQNDHKINSCMKCEQVIGCEIRKTYIKVVYESMNKGSSGGFEF